MEMSSSVYLSKDTVIKGSCLHGGDEAKYDKAYISIKDGEVEYTLFFNFEVGYTWTADRMMYAEFVRQMHAAINKIWDERLTLQEEREAKPKEVVSE